MLSTVNKNTIYWLLVIISVATLISGCLQMIKPDVILGIISGEISAGNLHSFAIVGMFMVLFGGLLLHALLSPKHHPLAVLWASLQKFGAFAAVAIGVINGVFSALAWGVAIFDLISGLLIIIYWFNIRHGDQQQQQTHEQDSV